MISDLEKENSEDFEHDSLNVRKRLSFADSGSAYDSDSDE